MTNSGITRRRILRSAATGGLAVAAASGAVGAARAYEGLLDAWVIDAADERLADRVRVELGVRVAVTDTVMRDDGIAEAIARRALELV